MLYLIPKLSVKNSMSFNKNKMQKYAIFLPASLASGDVHCILVPKSGILVHLGSRVDIVRTHMNR